MRLCDEHPIKQAGNVSFKEKVHRTKPEGSASCYQVFNSVASIVTTFARCCASLARPRHIPFDYSLC